MSHMCMCDSCPRHVCIQCNQLFPTRRFKKRQDLQTCESDSNILYIYLLQLTRFFLESACNVPAFKNMAAEVLPKKLHLPSIYLPFFTVFLVLFAAGSSPCVLSSCSFSKHTSLSPISRGTEFLITGIWMEESPELFM